MLVAGGHATEPFRTPSPVTLLRDDVAASESALASATAGQDDPAAQAEAAAVPIRLEALGGVSPTTSPRPSSLVVDATNDALDSARACVAAAGEVPLGRAVRLIELSHMVIIAASLTAVLPPPAPDAGVTPTGTTAVDTATLAQLALRHDRARARTR